MYLQSLFKGQFADNKVKYSPHHVCTGVAAAFEEKVHPHPLLVKLISGFFKTDDLSSPAMKMAHVG